MLQEDTAGETLLVLRQISQQTVSYTFQNGMLNSTIVVSATPASFQPSPTAIRVNALWFSSLICSLSTASIAILVKQWLRAFMSHKTSSVQGRMRLRHFRHQGVVDWKVFEVAAVLPILVQVALFLFFLGLCYFTADAHPSIGRATLTLVAAWGVFFAVFTLCPIFSARCPYKTAFLETVLDTFRLWSASALHVTLRCYSWCLRGCPGTGPGDGASSNGPSDEAEVVKSDGKDLLILASADALQSNDEMLGSVILDALKQSRPTAEDAVQFILNILRNRIPWESMALDGYPTFVNCQSLTHRGRVAISDMLSHIASNEPDLFPPRHEWGVPLVLWSESLQWLICILLSPTPFPLPMSGLRLLGRMLLESSWTRQEIAMLACGDNLATDHCSQRLTDILQSLQFICQETGQALADTLAYFKDVLDVYFAAANLPRASSPRAIAVLESERSDNPGQWCNVFSKRSLAPAIECLVELLRQHTGIRSAPNRARADTEQPEQSSDSPFEALVFLLRLVATVHDFSAGVCSLIDDLLALNTKEPLRAILWAAIHNPTFLAGNVVHGTGITSLGDSEQGDVRVSRRGT